MLYPAYVHLGDHQRAHGVTRPDFPGCFSAADDWHGLPAAIQAAVELYFENEELEVPEPTPLEIAARRGEYEGGVWMLVRCRRLLFKTRCSAPILRWVHRWLRRYKGDLTPLDTVVGTFRDGATAEEIAEQYPAISLGQVYAVIAYYLAHTAEVDDYLRIREQRATEVRQANERLFDPAGIRARLIARQVGQDSG